MDDNIKHSFIYSFDNKDEYLKDLITLNTKSLVDDKVSKSIYIDYKRLRSELIFYKHYGNKKDNLNYNINFILPIILSNVNLKKSENEVIKNITYYCEYHKETNKYNYILTGIAYNYLMNNLIKNSKLKFEDILNNIKKHIIEFYFEEKLEKKDIILFEKSRIYFIQRIDKLLNEELDSLKEENIVDGFFRVIYQIYIEDYEEYNEELKSIKNVILGILGFKIENIDIKNIDFIKSLASYILKLRKFEINKTLYNDNTNPKELISLNIGDSIYNPILNNIKVVDKRLENDILYIKVLSKSGEYLLKFKRT